MWLDQRRNACICGLTHAALLQLQDQQRQAVGKANDAVCTYSTLPSALFILCIHSVPGSSCCRRINAWWR